MLLGLFFMGILGFAFLFIFNEYDRESASKTAEITR
jgi:hypothetical protein